MQPLDFDPNVNYYTALGVTEKATADEIKKAYRKLAKSYHPDTTGGDKVKESRFKEVQSAYDVLGDSKRRGLYDQTRAGRGAQQTRVAHGATYTSQGPGPGVFDLGDLFSQFFSSGAATSRGGRVDADPETGGPRRKRRDAQDAEFESKVRASDGSWLRLEGADVYSDVRISFDRAILGTVATVATVDGKAEVKVPPGTSSGKQLRLRGKGIPDRSGGVGDHYISVQIDVPTVLDDDAKQQLIQLVTRLRRAKAPGGGGHGD